MNIALFSGSTRKDSINRKLVSAMKMKCEAAGLDVTVLDLLDFDMPIYNGDWEDENGVPQATKDLIEILAEQDAVFVASPEYNGGLPAVLKNTIDWMTRTDSMKAFHDPIWMIGSCTPGGMSGIMVMRQVQYILNRLGAHVLPVQLGVGNAAKAFNDDGSFAVEFNDTMADKQIAMLKSRLG